MTIERTDILNPTVMDDLNMPVHLRSNIEPELFGKFGVLAAGSVLKAEGFIAPVTKDELVESVTQNMESAAETWLKAVYAYPILEPPVGQRETTVKVVAVEADAKLPVGWQPSQTNVYSS